MFFCRHLQKISQNFLYNIKGKRPLKTVSFFVNKSLMIDSPPTFYQILSDDYINTSILLSTISFIGIIIIFCSAFKVKEILSIDSIIPS